MVNESWKTRCKNMFQYVDIYGSYVRLYIRGTNTYQTPLGGALTVLLGIASLFFSIFFGIDMVMKRNPKLINYINHYDMPFTLSNQNFGIALQFSFRNNSVIRFPHNEFFKIDVYNSSKDYLSEKSSNNRLELIKCEESMFKDFPKKAKDEVLDLIIKDCNCISMPNLNLHGSPFNSLNFKSIKFFLNVNMTKLTKNFSIQEITNMFPLYFRIFFQTYAFDLENYDDPLSRQLSYSEKRLFITENTLLFLSFLQANLTRDDGFIFPYKNTSAVLGFNKLELWKNNTEADPATGLATLLSTEIYMENFQEIFIRKYDKLPDVGAQVTAMVKIVNIIFQLICMLYTFDRINEQLAFKFYKYKFENQESPAELYNRRKTLMQKELKINFPLKNRNFSKIEKTFGILYNDKSVTEGKKSQISRFFETPTSIFKPAEAGNNLTQNNNSSDLASVIKEANDKYQQINDNTSRSHDNSTPRLKKDEANNSKKNGVNFIESSLRNPRSASLGNSKNYRNKLILNFDKIFQKQDKLTFRDKLKLTICCNLGGKLREKIHFYQKAKTKIKEKLDIVYILNKLDEFDKFKMMYLNPYQNLALSYCKKANILNTNYSNLIDFYENFCQGSDEKKNIINILEYFIYKLQKKETDILDKKLLEMIEPEILKAIHDNID